MVQQRFVPLRGAVAGLAAAMALLVGAAVFPVGALAAPGAAAAASAPVGFVRLAHLSPDTPAVDVYLASVSGAISPQVFHGVGYGVVSDYLPLPVGDYTISMRAAPSQPDDPIVVSTDLHVTANGAYTVAGVGRFVGIGLKVFLDNLALPHGGKAKMRVIHASIKDPTLTVTADDVAVVQHVTFATTTQYYQLDAGNVKLRLTPEPSGATVDKSVKLAAGNVYSLIILDTNNGLNVVLRTDATAPSSLPSGGVSTGGGGTAGGAKLFTIVSWVAGGVGIVVLIFLVSSLARRRQTTRF
jgi:hypothetical protein